ncbi:MAG: HAD-IIIA family hydrolase [Halothiobacillaceae bacterium]|jgi:3-deoxy-D-manno-octulosonate 8-phosphate phosphatase (KDO 8-P phosphatase)|nr:MAG: HAD-IIIA family hydrolase [Halothiobacillaceae bacterium]
MQDILAKNAAGSGVTSPQGDARRAEYGDVFSRARDICLVLFDVDGVLTDGRLVFNAQGEETKSFHSRDGHGIKLLMEAGIEVGVITARSSPAVEFRMKGLGIPHVFQGRHDKRSTYLELIGALGLSHEQVAYMGDDVIDLPVLSRVGLATTVQDAPAVVKRHCHWIAEHGGGRGAARDLCDLILDAQGKLDELLARYLA